VPDPVPVVPEPASKPRILRTLNYVSAQWSYNSSVSTGQFIICRSKKIFLFLFN